MLALLTVFLGLLLLGALVLLSVHVRNAVLGSRLMKACGDSWESAVREIENIRVQNDAVAAIVMGEHEDPK